MSRHPESSDTLQGSLQRSVYRNCAGELRWCCCTHYCRRERVDKDAGRSVRFDRPVCWRIIRRAAAIDVIDEKAPKNRSN